MSSQATCVLLSLREDGTVEWQGALLPWGGRRGCNNLPPSPYGSLTQPHVGPPGAAAGTPTRQAAESSPMGVLCAWPPLGSL